MAKLDQYKHASPEQKHTNIHIRLVMWGLHLSSNEAQEGLMSTGISFLLQIKMLKVLF